MKLVKLDKGYKEELLEVWKVAFEEDEEFSSELCNHFFNQEDLWQYAYGWIENNKLVSTYLTLDVNVLIRNKEFKGHYIDGLATLPSHRGKGLINKQMFNDAKGCLKNNIPLMLVDPSRDSFYRKFGFEFAVDQYRVTIDKNFCSKTKSNFDYTVREDILSDDRELQTAYKDINKLLFNYSRYNEMKWPKCYEDIKFKRTDITLAATFDHNNSPKGYILYTREGNDMIIESFRYLNLDAFYALKGHIMALDEYINRFTFNSIPEDFPIDLFIKDLGRPEKKLFLGSWISRMIRIINFKSLLEELLETTPISPICIHLIDDIIVENQGFYTILPSGKVEKHNNGDSDVTITITDIVPLLTGLKSAKELYYKGKLKVNGREVIGQSYVVPDIIREIDDILPKVITFSGDEYLAP